MLNPMRASTLVCVPPDDVPKLWPAVEHLIDAAYAATDQITPDVLTWLLERKGILWVAVVGELEIVAALTTSLEPRRGGLACRMVAASADGIDYCLPHLAAIEHYAIAEGCYKVEVSGRQGWGRRLPGYAPTTLSLEKRL